LGGDYQPDSGEYLIDGAHRHFRQPREAIEAGVSIIYQERQVVPYLSVAENIFMEGIPASKVHLIDFKALNQMAQAIIDEFRLPFHATDRVRDLSVAHQQMIEIMKAYRRSPAPRSSPLTSPPRRCPTQRLRRCLKSSGSSEKKASSSCTCPTA